jgi:hypothetical protein
MLSAIAFDREPWQMCRVVDCHGANLPGVNRRPRLFGAGSTPQTHNVAEAEYDRSATLAFPWSGAEIPAA